MSDLDVAETEFVTLIEADSLFVYFRGRRSFFNVSFSMNFPTCLFSIKSVSSFLHIFILYISRYTLRVPEGILKFLIFKQFPSTILVNRKEDESCSMVYFYSYHYFFTLLALTTTHGISQSSFYLNSLCLNIP